LNDTLTLKHNNIWSDRNVAQTIQMYLNSRPMQLDVVFITLRLR